MSYDANGRVTHITDHAVTGQNRAFTYDGLGRLSTASGPWGAGSYTYDLLNNIRSKSLGADTVEIQYNANNQISRARDTRDGNIWRREGTARQKLHLSRHPLRLLVICERDPSCVEGKAQQARYNGA